MMPKAQGVLMHLPVAPRGDADHARLKPWRAVLLGVEHPTPLVRRNAKRHRLTWREATATTVSAIAMVLRVVPVFLCMPVMPPRTPDFAAGDGTLDGRHPCWP